MIDGGHQDQAFASRRALPGAVWIALACLACLSVLILNGQPLYYFDSLGYVAQGRAALVKLGWHEPHAAAAAGAAVTAGAGAIVDLAGAGTVDGSRSAVYALLAGALSRIGVLEGLIAVNLLAVFLSVWIAMRAALRSLGASDRIAPFVAVPVIAACLGSLPFFIPYYMPDTLAPVLILTLATIAAFGRDMTLPEILLALLIGSFAIVSHLSHFAIAGLMLPLVVVVAVLLSRTNWWLPPMLVLIILAVGYSERVALSLAAKAVAESNVVIKPYITARLIQDGPGLRYLQAHCPDPAIATCLLFAALSKSDDPMRFTASHIVFEQSDRLGSFRLLPPEEQRHVARSQIAFFLDVLRDAPVSTTLAFVKNTLLQTRMFSVDMTLQTPAVIARVKGITGSLFGPPDAGRLTADTGYLRWLTPVQGVVYAGALIAILGLGLGLWPGRVPAGMRALALLILGGVLINALVCGGISQPATRYGARVIWLLPMAAAMLVMFARRPARVQGV